MKTIKGDLIKLADDNHFDVIVHGCNCQHMMGAGIAAQIAARWPAAFYADRFTVLSGGDDSKLGTCSTAIVDAANGNKLVIVNAYTQLYARPPKGEIADERRYAAIQECLVFIARVYATKHVGLPLIGAGLAGGSWPRIKGLIEKHLSPHCQVTIVEYQP